MDELNEQKIYEAFKNSIKLHLNLKDGSWRNGFVKEIGAGFFLFDDTINGVEPIFFLELDSVKPYVWEEK